MKNRTLPCALLLLAAASAICQDAAPRRFPANIPASPIPQQTAALARSEELTAFDPARVELKRQDDQWVLMTPDGVLKEFGRREEDARESWRLIRDLGLTQRGVVGKPQPIVEYWLCQGKPPTTVPRGLRLIALDPAALRIEQSQGFWVLRDATRVLFNFGVHEAEARQAQAVIRKYGFNQIAVVGQAIPSMLIFVARPDLRTEMPAMTTEPRDRAATRSRVLPVKSEKSGKPVATNDARFYPTPMLPALSSGTVVTHTRPTERRGPGGLRLTSAREQESQPTTPAITERVPFDWRQVHIHKVDGEWKLRAGGCTLASFGNSERDARIAHAVMLHYRFTEMHLVGGSESPVCYFLASGQAPRGLMVGVLSEHFRPEQLGARVINGHHWLMDGTHPVLDCGERPENVAHMRDVIQRLEFDHLCRVGSDPKRSLSFLVRSH